MIATTSCIGLALLHETVLCSAAQRLAVAAYRLRFTGVFLAFFDERRLGRPRERFSVLANGLSFTGLWANAEETRNADATIARNILMIGPPVAKEPLPQSERFRPTIR